MSGDCCRGALAGSGGLTTGGAASDDARRGHAGCLRLQRVVRAHGTVGRLSDVLLEVLGVRMQADERQDRGDLESLDRIVREVAHPQRAGDLNFAPAI